MFPKKGVGRYREKTVTLHLERRRYLIMLEVFCNKEDKLCLNLDPKLGNKTARWGLLN